MRKPKQSNAWGSKADVTRRAHATRLLGTLLKICGQLKTLQPDATARRAYGEVASHLRRLAEEYQ